MSDDEVALDQVARAIRVRAHAERMQKVLDDAKHLRTRFTPEQRTAIEDKASCPTLDEFEISVALSKICNQSLVGWQEVINDIESFADNCGPSLFTAQKLKIVQMFMIMMEELQPKSLRHLEQFLQAATDGDWVDLLVIAKGENSEVRMIDRCSEETKKEFGLPHKASA